MQTPNACVASEMTRTAMSTARPTITKTSNTAKPHAVKKWHVAVRRRRPRPARVNRLHSLLAPTLSCWRIGTTPADTVVNPPHLLSRLTKPSVSASCFSLPLAEMPPPSSAELSSSAGGDFLPCIADTAPSAPSPLPNPLAPSLAAPSFAPVPTPIAEYVGFPSLLPVLFYAEDRSLVAAPGSACLDADGSVDFNAHARFVFTTGGLTPDGLPAWRTTMTRRERFLTPQAIAARAERRLNPLLGISLGG